MKRTLRGMTSASGYAHSDNGEFTDLTRSAPGSGVAGRQRSPAECNAVAGRGLKRRHADTHTHAPSVFCGELR